MAGMRGLIAGALAAIAVAGAAPAVSEPVVVKSGAAQLPTSGLIIDLPANPALTYKVAGSWALADAPPNFDTRDIVDEYNVSTGALYAGNWVLVGYFTAGGCDGVLKGETLDKSWTTETTVWGETWLVRGGVYTFSSELGRKPAAVLCRSNAAGQSLVLYRFLVDQPETLGQADILRNVTQAGVLESASKSYNAGRTADILPLRRPETRNRGSTPANRTTTLGTTGLVVSFPDDGYVWLPEADQDVDFITRMAPSLPELSIEVVVVPGETCAGFLPKIEDQQPGLKPRNAPAGWMTGPTLIVEGETELTICQNSGGGAKLVGLFMPPGQTDLTVLHPIIIALGNARKP